MNTIVRLLTGLLLTCAVGVTVHAEVRAHADSGDAAFSRAELDQLLAPVALYPDVLLSQVMMAATYPLEVVEAARWSRDNPQLQGEEAVNAVADRDWDPSVMALVAFPELLSRMSEELEWTRRVGDAFLYQEADVMDAVQGLRDRAYSAGHLRSDDHVQVHRETRVITIQPANPRVIYVPYYDPIVVYGSWVWPVYAPYHWSPPRVYHRRAAFFWSYGVPVSTGFFFSTVNWYGRHVVVVHDHGHLFYRRPSLRHYDVWPRWRHNPVHRRGVAYRHPALDRRYGAHSAHARAQHRARRDHGQALAGAGLRSGQGALAHSAVPRLQGAPDRRSGREQRGRPDDAARRGAGSVRRGDDSVRAYLDHTPRAGDGRAHAAPGRDRAARDTSSGGIAPRGSIAGVGSPQRQRQERPAARETDSGRTAPGAGAVRGGDARHWQAPRRAGDGDSAAPARPAPAPDARTPSLSSRAPSLRSPPPSAASPRPPPVARAPSLSSRAPSISAGGRAPTQQSAPRQHRAGPAQSRPDRGGERRATR